MKRKLLCFAMILFSLISNAQFTIQSGGTFSENFNSSTATAVPTGWKSIKNSNAPGTISPYSSAGTSIDLNAGNAITISATNGIYRFDANSAGTDFALGGLSSGSASKNVTFYTKFTNNGANSISSFNISFDAEKYRNGTNTAGFSIKLFYSTDGSTWTAAGSNFNASFSGADASNAGATPTPISTVSISNQILLLNVAAGSDIYFAWNYQVTSGTTTSNAQGIGLDNVSIIANGNSAIACTTPTAPTSLNVVNNTTNPTTSQNISFTTSGASQYLIYKSATIPTFTALTDGSTYALGSSNGNGTLISINNTGSYTATGLTPGTSYYYSVIAANTGCTGEPFYITTSLSSSAVATVPTNGTLSSSGCLTPTSVNNLNFSASTSGYNDGVVIVGDYNAITTIPSGNVSSLTGANTDWSIASSFGATGKILYVGTASGAAGLNITNLTSGNTLYIKAFSYVGATGTLYSSGANFSQFLGINAVSNPASVASDQVLDVSWVNPTNTSCYDEILVVASSSAFTGIVPTGNGTNYVGSSVYSLGTPFDGGYIVYQGTGTTANIVGLTNNQLYNIEIFVRKGNDWSLAVTTNGTPTNLLPTKFNQGDLLIVGLITNGIDLTSNGACGSSGTSDRIDIMTLVDLNPGTNFEMTDDGYERVSVGTWGTGEGLWTFTYTGAQMPAGTIFHLYTGNINDATSLNSTLGWTVSKTVSQNNGNIDLNSGGDQVFIIQGGIWNASVSNNMTLTGGNILAAFSTNGQWNSLGGTTQQSGLPTQLACGALALASPSDYNTYTGLQTPASSSVWYSRITNIANWSTPSSCASYLSTVYAGPETILPSTGSLWVGGTSGDTENWFNCNNWSPRKVPAISDSVIIDGSSTFNCAIDFNANFSNGYGDTARCKYLSISGGKLKLYGSNLNLLIIEKDLSISGTGVLDMDDNIYGNNDGMIVLKGNMTNTVGGAGFLEGNSTVEFNGEDPQTINSGNNSENFYNIKINKTKKNNIELASNINIINNAEFINGYLKPSSLSNVVSFGTSATYNGASANSHIIGKAVKLNTSNFIFPIGNGFLYAPVKMNCIDVDDAMYALYQRQTPLNNTSLASTLDHISAVENWELGLYSLTGISSTDITFYWTDSSFVNSALDLRIAHYNSTSSMWEDMGGSLNLNNNSISLTGVTNFSPFTFSTTLNLQPLPIQHILLTNKKVNENDLELNWDVQSVNKNEILELVRISPRNTKKILYSGTNLKSTMIDIDTKENGLYQYYLNAKTTSGIATSEINLVNFDLRNQISFYPNPVENEINIINLSIGDKILIIDNLGKIVSETKVTNTTMKVNINNLSNGKYSLKTNNFTSAFIKK